MVRAVLIKGRLVGPTTVELDEPAPVDAHDVEVIVRSDEAQEAVEEESLAAFLRSLPPGGRSKAEIDEQHRRERDSWD